MEDNRTGFFSKKIIILLIIELLVLFALFFYNWKRNSDMDKQVTRQKMRMIAVASGQIIENYVLQTENVLMAYSHAGEVRTLLEHPEDSELQKRAQEYTRRFSADVDNLEGLYISEWNTHVLAHTNPKIVGITTRVGDSLRALQDSMLATPGVYNTGIIVSPASGKMIMSLYHAVRNEDGEPIGLVGAGVNTEGLGSQIGRQLLEGGEQMNYFVVNVRNVQYIFSEDLDKANQSVENKAIYSMCQKLQNQSEDEVGFIEYTDELSGERMLVAYNYMADRKWVYLLTSPE